MDRDLAPAVLTHAGFSGSDHPEAVRWQGHDLPVTNIIREWREPGSKQYLVETEAGMHFKLVLSEDSGRWIISPVNFKSNS